MAFGPEMQHIPSATKIRPFRTDDVAAVTQILQDSPEAASWSSAALGELIGQPGALAFVVEENSRVSGFIACRQVADEAEVLNLGVAPRSRRSGQGSALLYTVVGELRHRKVKRVFLEVRESNAAAIAFYGKHGFAPTGRRPAYYRDPDEDAICMEAKLTT